MKIVTVPDLHGKDVWNKIDPDNYDKIIFLGDYVDAPYRDIEHVKPIDYMSGIIIDKNNGKTNTEILYNLKNIIQFKDKYPDKVELLLGNHDVPYIYHIKNKSLQRTIMCSGYRYSMENELSKLFNNNIKKFKIAYKIKNIIFSHAGITPSAYNTYFKNKYNNNLDILVDELNISFILNDPEIFYISYKRGGNHPYGSILWADISEWIEEKYNFPFVQVVGHSHVNKISYLYDDNTISTNRQLKEANVTFTDCLNSITEFYEIEL